MNMTERAWSVDQVWDNLGKIFNRPEAERYRLMSADPESAFATARKELSASVGDLASGTHDINDSEPRQLMILAHMVLAVLGGLQKGISKWHPMPSLETLTWSKKETALLLWAAKHVTPDEAGFNAARNSQDSAL